MHLCVCECVLSLCFCDDSGGGNDSKGPSESWAGRELYGSRKRQQERASKQIPPIMLCFQGTDSTTTMEVLSNFTKNQDLKWEKYQAG